MKYKNLFILVTEDFHKEVKMHCASKDIAMNKWITALITKELFKDSRKKGK